MQRRQFMLAMSALMLAPRLFADERVVVVQFADDGRMLGLATLPRVRQDAEWKKRLSPLAYHVTREAGTERPFSQPGYDRHDPGLYRCICCDNALFDANTKYDSKTGWPSFWQPIAAQNLSEIPDHLLGIERTEVRCTLCDAHLGHLFDDGPKPTGLRYCMNTVAMRFIRAQRLPR